jgi:hypothetical protein
MQVCYISGQLKIGTNDAGETFVWWDEGNKWLTMDEFQKCEIEAGTKLILQIKEDIPYKVNKKHVAPHHSLPTTSPFNTDLSYSLAPTPLKLNLKEFIYETRQPTQPQAIPQPDHALSSISDLLVGGAATIAMALAIFQQIKQKKQQADNQLCCNNNKLEISKFDAKLQKLEADLKTEQSKDTKSFLAELAETRREIHTVKDDLKHDKEDIQKIVEIIQLQNQNQQNKKG